jgi:hypothetical protein
MVWVIYYHIKAFFINLHLSSPPIVCTTPNSTEDLTPHSFGRTSFKMFFKSPWLTRLLLSLVYKLNSQQVPFQVKFYRIYKKCIKNNGLCANGPKTCFGSGTTLLNFHHCTKSDVICLLQQAPSWEGTDKCPWCGCGLGADS